MQQRPGEGMGEPYLHGALGLAEDLCGRHDVRLDIHDGCKAEIGRVGEPLALGKLGICR